MARKIASLVGKKFGQLIVVGLDHQRKKDGLYYWKCWCNACNRFCVILGANLVNGTATNCGCIDRKTNPKSNYKHGMRYTRLYRIYRDMRNRCENKNDKHYQYYGARGITICKEWKEDPVAFFSWAQSHGYRDDLTIDRIDSLKGYSPENCRWADVYQQANNQITNVRLEYNGVEHTMAEWSRYFDLPYSIFNYYVTTRMLPVKEAALSTAKRCKVRGIDAPTEDDIEEKLALIGGNFVAKEEDTLD